jgi:hypothetical protein
MADKLTRTLTQLEDNLDSLEEDSISKQIRNTRRWYNRLLKGSLDSLGEGSISKQILNTRR